MRSRLLLMLLLVTIPASAAISRTGSVAAAATSGTFTATATGDFKIVFAYRSSSATPPSLPAGWTTIATVVQGTTSARIGCNVSSSGSDTGSGTWTNATNIVGASYAGTGVDQTSDCIGTGTVAFVTNHASSATVNFPALTMARTGGTSWVAGFAAGATSLAAAPTGMTQFTTSGNVGANDTNATATSWSSQNVTVTSQAWLTATLEILAPQPVISNTVDSHNQIVYSANSAETGNTFLASLPNPVGATGNTLVLFLSNAFSAGRTYSITDNKGNSWPSTPTVTTNDGSVSTSIFVLPNALSGTQTFTITFDTAILGVQIAIKEFYNVANTSPVDVSCSANAITGPTVACSSMTTGTSGDLILNYAVDTGGGNAGASGNLPIRGYVAGNNFTPMAGTDIGVFLQFGIQAAAGAINPTATISQAANDTFNSVGVALKTGSFGTAPPSTGIRVNSIWKYMLNLSPIHILTPSYGNLVTMAQSPGTSQDNVTSFADSNANSYTKLTSGTLFPQWFYTAATATTSPGMVSTIVQGTPGSHGDGAVFDISGAASAAFDKSATGTATIAAATTTTQSRIATDTTVTIAASAGIANNDFLMWENEIVQVTAGGGTTTLTISRHQRGTTAASHATSTNLIETAQTSAPLITPSTSNGLVLDCVNIGTGPFYQTPAGTSGIVGDNIYYTGMTDSSTTDVDFVSHYYNPSTSQVNFGVNAQNGSVLSTWQALALAFKAAPPSTIPGQFPRMQ